jgi:exopolysaccharide biosynthesis polyprenyl glycosylphosphotransferase
MTSIVIVMATTFFLQPLVYSRGMLVVAGGLIVILASGGRLVRLLIEASLRQRGIGVAHVVIVGAGELGRSVIRAILADPGLGYQIVGYMDDNPTKGESNLGRIEGLGGIEELGRVIAERDVDEVMVTLPWMYHRKIVQIVEQCERKGVGVQVVPDVFQQRMSRVDLETLNGIPLISTGGEPRFSASAQVTKRVIDALITLLALPFFALFTLLIGLLIKLDDRGPIFFRHKRVGKDGREFYAYKLRTMFEGAEHLEEKMRAQDENISGGATVKIPEDPRRTRVGVWLRKTSLDELPQIINIIRGEMSWIGPRPGTPEEVGLYDPWQRKRLSVLPGITGLWQVSGRSNVPFDEMCLLDIFYIENWSLDLELRIILQTIPSMLTGKGAY